MKKGFLLAGAIIAIFSVYFFVMDCDFYNFMKGRSYKDAEQLKVGMNINEIVTTMKGHPEGIYEYFDDSTSLIGLIYSYNQIGGVEIRIHLDKNYEMKKIIWGD